ncbi:MAG: Serine/threonine protein kinase [Labilithrix sp.]|nr:Serine/threonine protein kinase [Labilithrix sp.]
MDIDVGQVIAGKYELVRLLGKGAMGEVWLAHHNSLGGHFAIKLVEPNDDIEAETAAGRFQLEAQIAAKLSRKTRHIVSVSDHGEENGLAYLVMELLEGESLDARTRRERMSLPEVGAVVSQVARALSLAHDDGVFHRDLKPANVWLGRDEDGRLLVKLLDFGIARSMKPVNTRSPFATSKDMVLGTPSYMSPEQARGLDSLDYRCDLWALAVVAYEALTGKIPFEGETVEDIFLSICTFRVVPIRARRPELPPELDAFFARAFASNLAERFATAAELTAAFEELIAPEDLEAALGIPLTPTSARRLEAVRAREASRPNLAPPSNSDPYLPPTRGSTPDYENVALGAPTIMARRSGGATPWLLAIAGLIALLAIGIFALVAFRGTGKSAAVQPSEERSGTAPIVTPPPPASSPSVVTIELPPSEGEPPPPTPKASAVGRVKPSGPKSTTTNTTTHPPAPTPAPTPTTAKSVNKDKGDVF